MSILYGLLRKNWLLVTGALGLLLLGNGITLLWNTYISEIVNCIGERQPITEQVFGMAVLCILLTSSCSYLGGIVSGWTCETLNHDLRMGFTNHLFIKPFQEMESLSVGGQMSILQNEIAEISEYINGNLASLVNTMVAFLVTIVFLWKQSPILTIATNLPVVVILLYVWISSQIIGGLAQKAQEKKQEMNGIVDALIEVYPMAHLYEATDFLCRTHDSTVQQWEVAAIKEEKIRARLMSLSALFSCIPLLILLLAGGIMVIRGEITMGIVYIFINLSKNVSGAMMNLPGLIASFRRFVVNLNRVKGCIKILG